MDKRGPQIPIASIEERPTLVVVIPMASMRLLQRWVLASLLSGGLLSEGFLRAAEIDFARQRQKAQARGASTPQTEER